MVGFLNLFPDTCWSQLTSWVMFDDLCIQDLVSQKCENSSWCGKCAFNGRLDDPATREAYRPWKGFKIRFKPFADFACNRLCSCCPKELKPVFQGKVTVRFR